MKFSIIVFHLGLDDLTVFKCFRVIFFLKKQTIQFLFSFDLYFQQKSPKVVHLKALFEFLTSQTGKTVFIIFNVIIRELCISLTHQPKAVHYFETTLKSLSEIAFLS